MATKKQRERKLKRRQAHAARLRRVERAAPIQNIGVAKSLRVYEDFTRDQLRDEVVRRGIKVKGISRYRKAQLIEALRKDDHG